MIPRLREFLDRLTPPRFRLLVAGLWLVFLTLDTGRLLIPILILLHAWPAERRERFARLGVAWAMHVVAFLGFFLHPAARVDPLAFFVAFLMAVAVGFLYASYRLWPVLVLPRPRLALIWNVVLWLALVLITEWGLEAFHISIGVPVYFLSDAGALPLLAPASRVLGPWTVVWLWGLLVFGLLWGREIRGWFLAGLGLAGLLLSSIRAPSLEVRPVPNTTFVLITPGIIYDAPLETYLKRYDILLAKMRENPPPGDTLWLVFPEGSFLGTTFKEGMLDTVRTWMDSVDRTIPRPHGWIWHMVVKEDGRIHTRVEVITPRGDTLHYAKRVLFIGGEKYVPLVSWFFGEGRVPGSLDQPGYFRLGAGWVAHFLICNESLDPLLVHPSPDSLGVIFAPSQLGWIYFPLFLKAIALRHRLAVNQTGLPLCTIQREGGIGCYLPTPEGVQRIGFLTSLGPNILAVRAPVGRQNPYHRHVHRFFWGVLLFTTLLMVGLEKGILPRRSGRS